MSDLQKQFLKFLCSYLPRLENFASRTWAARPKDIGKSFLHHFAWGWRLALSFPITWALSLSIIQHDLNKSKNEKGRKIVIKILVEDKRAFKQ